MRFQKDRHTFGDGNVAVPNESDGMDTDDTEDSPNDVGSGGIRILNKSLGVSTRKFSENGMGPPSEVTSVDVNGVLAQINARQAQDGAAYSNPPIDDELSEYDMPQDGRWGNNG